MLPTGSLIKLFRERKNIKQKDFAKNLNITATYLSLIEKGKKEGSLSFYKNVAKGLNVPIWLLVWDDFELSEQPTKDDIKLKNKFDEIVPNLRDFMLKKILHDKNS